MIGNKKIFISLLTTVGLIFSTVSFVNASQNLELSNNIKISKSKLAGDDRYKTAVEISKSGWTKSEKALLVNGIALPDALCSSPLADEYNAPILLTEKENINQDTLNELKRLGVKEITLIGSSGVISKEQEEYFISNGYKVERLGGKDRVDTSIKVANKLKTIYSSKNIKSPKNVFIVNGIKGLADATSISSPAGIKDGVILYTNGTNLDGIKKYIETSADNIYLIGGKSVISNSVESELKNTTNKKIIRLEGIDRKDTNAKVINEFFDTEDFNKIYLAKDGMSTIDHLVDGLAVGSLASKNNSPVMIASHNIGNTQKEILESRNISEIVQVGNGINSSSFEEAVKIINESIKELIYDIDSIIDIDKSKVKTNIDHNKEYLHGWPTIKVDSEIYINPNGNTTICVDNVDKLNMYELDTNMKVIKSINITKELPIYGNFTKDDEGNYYVLYGKALNEDESNKTALMLVKYNSNGEKLKALALSGNTENSFLGVKTPFDAGNCKLKVSGDYITAYMARTMFKATDGLNHQASFGFLAKTSDLSRVSTVSNPYVSHSFNQNILVDGDDFVYVDQGDFYPRGYEISKFSKENWEHKGSIVPFVFKESATYQYTYSQLGGLIKLNDNYFLIGTSEKSNNVNSTNNDYSHFDSRNVFIQRIDSSLKTYDKPIWITNYSNKKSENAAHPKVCKLNNNEYIVIWELHDANDSFEESTYKSTEFAIIDGDGNITKQGSIYNTRLSKEGEIHYNNKTNKVEWTIIDNNSVKLNSFDPYSVKKRPIKNFTLDKLNKHDEKITGKGLKGSTVKAYVNNKQIGDTAVVDGDGNYKINIPKQELGTKVTVEISKKGYTKKYQTIEVVNKEIRTANEVYKELESRGWRWNDFTESLESINSTRFYTTGQYRDESVDMKIDYYPYYANDLLETLELILGKNNAQELYKLVKKNNNNQINTVYYGNRKIEYYCYNEHYATIIFYPIIVP